MTNCLSSIGKSVVKFALALLLGFPILAQASSETGDGNQWLIQTFEKLSLSGPVLGSATHIAVDPPFPFIFGKKREFECSLTAVTKTERDLNYSEGYIDNRYIKVICPDSISAFISPDIHGEASVEMDDENNLVIKKRALQYVVEDCRLLDGCHKAQVSLTIHPQTLEVKRFYMTLPGNKQYIYPVLNSYKKVKFEFRPY